MAAQAGRDILLKLSDGAPTPAFISVAGLRARTIALAAKPVDGTAADSPGAWRELVPGAGLKEVTVSGSGVFRDSASDALIRTTFFAQDRRSWQLLIPDFGTLSGPFVVSALEYGGTHDGEATFSITLSSAGEITFGAL
jgi:TP901-1 family phage major tail protein